MGKKGTNITMELYISYHRDSLASPAAWQQARRSYSSTDQSAAGGSLNLSELDDDSDLEATPQRSLNACMFKTCQLFLMQTVASRRRKLPASVLPDRRTKSSF